MRWNGSLRSKLYLEFEFRITFKMARDGMRFLLSSEWHTWWGKHGFRLCAHSICIFAADSLSHALSTINWISAFSKFNRYMAIFRKFFESKRKCKCLIIITLPFWLVPRLFARLEKFSFECIIPLDINEFLFVRYIFQLCCKVTHFSGKTCRMCFVFCSHLIVPNYSMHIEGRCPRVVARNYP